MSSNDSLSLNTNKVIVGLFTRKLKFYTKQELIPDKCDALVYQIYSKIEQIWRRLYIPFIGRILDTCKIDYPHWLN